MAHESRSSSSRNGNYSGPRDYSSNNHSSSTLPQRNGHGSLPPRPPANRDAYRPSSRSGQGDQYSRGGDSRYDDSRSRNDYAPRYPPPPGGDSYRPPQSDFTFRAEKPSGVQDADRYQPQDNARSGSRRDQQAGQRGSRGRRGRQPRIGDNSRAQPQRNFGSRPWRPFVPAERELLSGSHDTGSERALFNTDSGVTYRPLEELSDSDEAEMDISGDEADDSSQPAHKRSRLTKDQSAAGNSVPKWSNPDPYTALPPEAATQTKKKDVVQLIRKARVQTSEAKSSIPTEVEEFISCDFDSSDDSDGEAEKPPNKAKTSPPRVPGAPKGPRSSGPTSTPVLPAPPVGLPAPSLLPPPPPSLPPPPPPREQPKAPFSSRDPTSSALGSRKRTHDDVIKIPDVKLGKPIGPNGKGLVVTAWREVAGEDPIPWVTEDHSGTRKPGVWLHKEIADFYEFVRPRDFEDRIRTELVNDLKRFCRRIWRDAEVYPFGSFPTGLYLPTSDMDLVVVSDQYLHSGRPPKYDHKKFLYKFGDNLRYDNRVLKKEIEFIVHAKVPLVKFVDALTCLKVDISFENTGGLEAVGTFNAWKEQYPAMPILVTLIKHLLCMRGLNEPVNGGIGGFSIICLVVSMFQMMPQVQSRSMETTHHLGDLFLEFLDLYGNNFNYTTTAISLRPPKYIPKNKVQTFTYKNPDRFSIIDPNNSSNDISGGSKLSSMIVETFREAHQKINSRLAAVASEDVGAFYSLLQPVFGGNYSSFRIQRRHLERLANGNNRA